MQVRSAFSPFVMVFTPTSQPLMTAPVYHGVPGVSTRARQAQAKVPVVRNETHSMAARARMLLATPRTLAQRELERLVAVAAAVKLGAVQEGAHVVHCGVAHVSVLRRF